MNEHAKPFARGRCDSCEANRPQECLSPRGGCFCAECRPPPERTYTRAEVLALVERVRERAAMALDAVARECATLAAQPTHRATGADYDRVAALVRALDAEALMGDEP